MRNEHREWYSDKGVLIDFYKALEVSCNARIEVVDSAYKALIKLVHEDKGMSHKTNTILNLARDALTENREEYDKRYFGRNDRVVGSYEILEKIGEGGFGFTYKAKHRILEELVCIKQSREVSEKDEEILLNESKVIWDLRHVGLPSMRDILRLDDGSLALVMSYISDPSFDKILKKVDKLSAEHVSWIAERTLNVLGYMHYNGVVHGDIKPGNMMVNVKDHKITLVDFGLSTIRPKSGSSNNGHTPLFAPPEQISDSSPPTPQTDLYSLGMTMIYSLNGADNEDDVKASVRKSIPKDVPKPIKDFIERLIIYNPKERPRWEEENLTETLGKARLEAFGRRRSGVLQIKGL